MSFNAQVLSGFAGSADIARQIVIKNTPYQIERADDVIVQAGGQDVTLPVSTSTAHLTVELLYIIMADAFSCTVQGGPNTINGKPSLTIPAENFAILVWDGAEWLGMIGGSGGALSLLQAAWFIDPVSGNDANDGLTALTAIKTYAELKSRWGTTAPMLPQTTTVTWLSNQPVGLDEVICNPVMLNGSKFFMTGTPVLVSSGILAGVVSKNRATAQLLNADLGIGPIAGQLIRNNTHSSYAWTDSLVAGTTFAMTQPLAPSPTPPTAINAPLPEVDTWANGDAFDVFEVTIVNLQQFAPTFFDGDLAGDVEFCYLQHIGVPDPVAPGSSYCRVNSCTVMTESRTDRFLTCDNVAGNTGTFSNVWMNGSCDLIGIQVYAGAIDTSLAFPSAFQNCFVDADVMIHGGVMASIYPFNAGFVWADGAVVVTQKLSLQTIAYGGDALWGPCSLEATGGGRVTFLTSSTTELLNTGALKLDNGIIGVTLDKATGVWTGGVGLIRPNIDAAQGKALFNPQSGSGFSQALP